MAYKSSDVETAYIRLLDAVCSWERATGREITIVMIPHNPDEPIGLSNSGKPWYNHQKDDIVSALDFALRARRDAR